MNITISYCEFKHYPKGSRNQWVWMFKRYTYIKGFIVRIFGIYINVTESSPFEKLIAAKPKKSLKDN